MRFSGYVDLGLKLCKSYDLLTDIEGRKIISKYEIVHLFCIADSNNINTFHDLLDLVHSYVKFNGKVDYSKVRLKNYCMNSNDYVVKVLPDSMHKILDNELELLSSFTDINDLNSNLYKLINLSEKVMYLYSPVLNKVEDVVDILSLRISQFNWYNYISCLDITNDLCLFEPGGLSYSDVNVFRKRYNSRELKVLISAMYYVCLCYRNIETCLNTDGKDIGLIISMINRLLNLWKEQVNFDKDCIID